MNKLTVTLVLIAASIHAQATPIDKVLAWKHANGMHDVYVSMTVWDDGTNITAVAGFDEVPDIVEQVNAITDEQISDYVAERDAAKLAIAAELQQLSASLDALVFVELGEHIDGTDEQLARLSALVVSNLESNRIEYAAAETLAELKAAGTRINNLRSIVSLQAKIVSLRE